MIIRDRTRLTDSLSRQFHNSIGNSDKSQSFFYRFFRFEEGITNLTPNNVIEW